MPVRHVLAHRSPSTAAFAVAMLFAALLAVCLSTSQAARAADASADSADATPAARADVDAADDAMNDDAPDDARADDARADDACADDARADDDSADDDKVDRDDDVDEDEADGDDDNDDEPVVVLRSEDFGLGQQRDSTPAALAMMQAARKAGRAKLVIRRGTYHFYPEKAFEKYCFITNHDDGLCATPWPILGLHDFEIAGEGAEFIFHGLMLPLMIEDSRNIRLSGFSIDWETPLHSEARVAAADAAAHTFDLAIPWNCPYEIRNGELFFLKEGYEHNLDCAYLWDPKTEAAAYDDRRYIRLITGDQSLVRHLDALDDLYRPDPRTAAYRYRGVENILMASEIEPGLVRIAGDRLALPPLGHVVIAKGRNAYNRRAPAIRVLRCRDLTLTDVTVHHAGGMGIVCERSENITLRRFDVKRRPGSGSLLTTAADATHFNNCRGLVRMEECLLENMLDDGTNIHGTYTRVEDLIDRHTLGMRIGHFQQMGFDFAEAGDRLGFVRPGRSLKPYAAAVVDRVEQRNKRYYLITFKEEIDPQVRAGDLLDNLDWSPRVVIRNCTVRNNMARSLLLKAPGPILCEGNRLGSEQAAIILSAGFGGEWYESGVPRQCVIRNNEFLDTAYGVPMPAIVFHAADSSDAAVFGRIVIENNAFNSYDSGVLAANRVEHLVFRGNAVRTSGNYPPLEPNRPALAIKGCGQVEIEGNRFDTPFPQKLQLDAMSKQHLKMSGNAGL